MSYLNILARCNYYNNTISSHFYSPIYKSNISVRTYSQPSKKTLVRVKRSSYHHQKGVDTSEQINYTLTTL